MGEPEKKSSEDKGLFDGIEPNWEGGVKDSHEDKRVERGVGNRKPKEPPKGETKREFSLGPFFKKKLQEKPYAAVDTRAPGEQSETFAQVMRVAVGDVEVLSATANLEEGKVKVVGVKHKTEASLVHAEVNVIKTIMKMFVSETKKPPLEPPAPPPPPAPTAARVGDLTVHGSPLLPGIGSPNVMIGGMPAWRAIGDVHVCPFPSTPPHGIGSVLQGATTVLINGMPAVRAGDLLVEPTGGANMVAMGYPTVMIGPPAAPAPPPVPPAPELPAELPWVKFESVAKGDVYAAEAEVQVYAEADLAQRKAVVELQAGGMAAMIKGEIPLKVRIRIPHTEYYVGLGVTVEGSLLSAGAEAGFGLKINDGAKLFDGTAGAKVGAGVGGVGVKFGIDVAK
jgi:uncharacterized Zn-binding protein involved in type VI secretion